MAFTLTELMAIFPNQLWLELPEPEQEQAWQAVTQQPYSNAAAQWNGYLNTLCLNPLLVWLQDEFDPEARSTADVSIWEFVNGALVTLGETRIVIIPEDKSNVSEFCIPQEWVDIAPWAAEYYLAVQINLDDRWLRVWGYATHQQIREQARYEAIDRTYCLDAEALVSDLNVMWVAQELLPPRKPEVQAFPSLLSSQIEPLLDKLGDSIAYSARLSVSFPEWAAILAHDQYRHDLYRRRTENSVENNCRTPVA